jgi:chorismate--pyruvate lyase
MALGLPRAGRRVFVRQVCVRRDGKPAVLARSVTTMAGIAGPWQGLRTLGRQPLATLLWSKPDISRGAFEYARLKADDALLLATRVRGAPPARRSCFWRQGHPLVVLEAFVGLPWPGTPWLSRRRHWTA